MTNKILYSDGTTSSISIEDEFDLTTFDGEKYILNYRDKQFVWTDCWTEVPSNS